MNKEPEHHSESTGSTVTLSMKDFNRLSEFIHTEFGIKMPPAKKTMLEARLQKRLRLLGYTSFSRYIDYVFSPQGQQDELIAMIDAVTTNKTDFFREPDHFQYLVHTAVPQLMCDTENAGKPLHDIKLWSAGCSSGEEPYTLAMVMSEFQVQHPGIGFHILATDISTRVLQHAMAGIYEEERIQPVPMALRRKYIMRSKDRSKTLVRIVPELRMAITFERLNFLDDDFGIRQTFDIIFCRNVIIYFDRETQGVLLAKLTSYLKPGGYLFMGHSETINGLNLPLIPVAPAAYRKEGEYA